MSEPPRYEAYPPPPAAPPPRKTWLVPVVVLSVVFVFAVAALLVIVLLLPDDEDPERGGPAALRQPVRFLAVQASEPGPCKAGRLPAPTGNECLQVGAGMTVTRVSDIRVRRPDLARGRSGYSVALSFTPEDGQTFARMSTTASQAQPPANQIAIVAEDRVLSAPVVATPITGGDVEISGPPAQFTREYTEGLVRRIAGR